jgi:predicted homoserine dehydrogenase-like protein
MTAADSLKLGALPIGLAHNMILNKDIPIGKPVCWSDVDYDATHQAIQFRREMEKLFCQ